MFSLMEAQSPAHILPEHLHMALMAWLHLNNAEAAQRAAASQSALTAKWSAAQQQAAMSATLQLLQSRPSDLVAAQCAQQVWMIAVSNNLPDRDSQLQACVTALLSDQRSSEAYQVSTSYAATQ